MEQKRIILVGAPGSGKNKVKDFLPSSLSIKWIGRPLVNGKAVGPLADYRQEIKLATSRLNYGPSEIAKFYSTKAHIVLTHTLLDSVAYPAVRLFRMVNSGSVSDMEQLRWAQTMNTNALMMFDSLPVYPIFFLRGNDGESFSEDLEAALHTILNDWNFPHLELTSPEDVATMLEKVFLEDFDIEGAIAASGKVAASSVNQDDQ